MDHTIADVGARQAALRVLRAVTAARARAHPIGGGRLRAGLPDARRSLATRKDADPFMVCHVVLFRVRPGLAAEERAALATALRQALATIPSIRRAHVGRRVTHGREYERAMTEDMEYAAVLEFDDMAGLQTYLHHPAHVELGARFNAAAAAAYVYDYEMAGGSSLEGMLATW
jgi:hypothetical protein